MFMVLAPLALIAQLTLAQVAESSALEFIDTWCVHCHSGEKPKGKVDFESILARLASHSLTTSDRSVLRAAAARVRAAEMPPPEEDDRPTAADASLGSDALIALLRNRDGFVAPAGGAPRRLNRAEYANAMQDLLGIDVALLGALPPDEIGAGFDNIATVLSLAPNALERYVDLAESIAEVSCPEVDAAEPVIRQIALKDFKISEKSGRVSAKMLTIWSNGEASARVNLPRAGLYTLRVHAAAQQAGEEVVKIALSVDGKPVAYFDLQEPYETRSTRSAEIAIAGGSHTIGVMFLNDYYLKSGPEGKPLDRNLAVIEFACVGPVDEQRIPSWQRVMSDELSLDEELPAREREEAEFRWLVATFLRRPATVEDLHVLEVALAPLAASAARETRLRAAITTLLVHPEFLFRVERDPIAPAVQRELDDYEIATRLAAFLWSSVPDARLRTSADARAFTRFATRRALIHEMLDDPRASRLSDRFASQWLRIDALESRTPDATRFPEINTALLASMRDETVLLFDSVLREGRSVATLLNADYTFVDAPLAKHYGMSPPTRAGMQRVAIDPTRGGGVIAHASVLLATSNPTRTSPVKRGKWVLESMLDAAPPPPPPGTAQLPREADDPTGKTMRQLLESHRADPNCAACHRRMDALGFALEQWDAVGRHRPSSAATSIDDRGDLPDGRAVVGLSGVREVLLSDPAFLRSVVKHLLIYATGREQGEHDEIVIDDLIENLGSTPTLRQVVIAVAESPSMRMRGVQ